MLDGFRLICNKTLRRYSILVKASPLFSILWNMRHNFREYFLSSTVRSSSLWISFLLITTMSCSLRWFCFRGLIWSWCFIISSIIFFSRSLVGAVSSPSMASTSSTIGQLQSSLDQSLCLDNYQSPYSVPDSLYKKIKSIAISLINE